MDSWNILLGENLEMSLEMSISKVFTYSRSSWLNKLDGIVGYYISSHRSNSIFSNRGEDFLPVLLKFRFSFLSFSRFYERILRVSLGEERLFHTTRERETLLFRFHLDLIWERKHKLGLQCLIMAAGRRGGVACAWRLPTKRIIAEKFLVSIGRDRRAIN